MQTLEKQKAKTDTKTCVVLFTGHLTVFVRTPITLPSNVNIDEIDAETLAGLAQVDGEWCDDLHGVEMPHETHEVSGIEFEWGDDDPAHYEANDTIEITAEQLAQAK